MSEFLNIFQSNVWAFVDALITLGTLYGVGYNYIQNKKQQQLVKIYIKDTRTMGKEMPIPSFILRRNFNRVEVKGILKELHKGSEYDIDYISNPKSSFLEDIYKIQSGKSDKLVIKIKEGDKFELKKEIE